MKRSEITIELADITQDNDEFFGQNYGVTCPEGYFLMEVSKDKKSGEYTCFFSKNMMDVFDVEFPNDNHVEHLKTLILTADAVRAIDWDDLLQR